MLRRVKAPARNGCTKRARGGEPVPSYTLKEYRISRAAGIPIFRGIRIRHRQAATVTKKLCLLYARGICIRIRKDTARGTAIFFSRGFSGGLLSQFVVLKMVYARGNLYTTPVYGKRERERKMAKERKRYRTVKVKGCVVWGSGESRECRYGMSTAELIRHDRAVCSSREYVLQQARSSPTVLSPRPFLRVNGARYGGASKYER